MLWEILLVAVPMACIGACGVLLGWWLHAYTVLCRTPISEPETDEDRAWREAIESLQREWES